MQLLADQALSRAAGAPLVGGNAVELLRDGRENYPAWLNAINAARHTIHFESYILHSDRTGQIFADAMIARARDGVRVRILVDWLGSFMKSPRRFWRAFHDAGVEVRAFNPPVIHSPFGWLARDHRKSLIVDGAVAFVSGLCVGDEWAGDPARGREPWRDPGVSLRGPAVFDIATAFSETWNLAGPPLPAQELPTADAVAPAGDVALRVVATEPSVAGVFRLDQLVASLARTTLWVTDAYFVGVAAYVRALVAAAQDGVDVRLLLPGAGTDVALVQRLTRAGYRTLLEGGVRIFEWNGPMIHAKTAVADCRWARVGSTNLNLQSWVGNWELDVAIEDEGFGVAMQTMFEEDLQRSTEIVLHARKVRASVARAPERVRGRAGGARRAATAGAIRLGRTLGTALTARREAGPAEASNLFWSSLLFLVLGAMALVVPEAVAIPLGVIAIWLSIAGLFQAWRLYSDPRDRP